MASNMWPASAARRPRATSTDAHERPGIMGTLRTATFTLSLEDADDDLLEGVAAAFTRALHGVGLTPRDAIEAWWRLETWENAGFPREADPGGDWRCRMNSAAQALRAAWAIAAHGGCTRGFRIAARLNP